MWLKELFVERDDDDRNVTVSLIDKKEECASQNVHNPRHDDEELALPHVQCQQPVMVKSTYLPFYIVGNTLFCKLYFFSNDVHLFIYKQIKDLSSFSAAEGRYDLSHLFVVSNAVIQLFCILSQTMFTTQLSPQQSF